MPQASVDETVTSTRPYLSLVLPAYNEEENIEEAVVQAIPPLEAITRAWEIVVVNDASTDATAAVAQALADRNPGRVRVVHHLENHGLGMAMRTGFAQATGEIIVYCDSDLPFDMAALVDAHVVLEAGQADLVNGYRSNRKDDGLRRRLYTATYNRLVQLTLDIHVRDVNCPLKMFRRRVLEAQDLRSRGCFIDAELLARTRKAGYRIAEVPVHYTPRVHGTSTLARPSVIVEVIRELMLYKLGRLRGEPAPTRTAAHEPVRQGQLAPGGV